MRYLIAALALMATGIVHAQSVTTKANVTWTLPITNTDGTAIAAGTLTQVKVWAATAPILDTDTSAPLAVLAGTATSYAYGGQVPNGSNLYFRLKACTAVACSAFGPQVSKWVKIVIPNPPTVPAVTVTVTISG